MLPIYSNQVMPTVASEISLHSQVIDAFSVVDLEGVTVVRLNPPLGPNYFSFMEKFMKNQVKG